MTRSPRLSLLASALALAAFGQAGAASITREFTAAWHDPSRPGHGLGLEVIDSGGNKNALAYWFTYDRSGRQLWLFGTAPVLGDSVSMTVVSTSGGAFDNRFDPAQVRATPWGTITLSFSDCNTGRLDFDPIDPALPSGSMPLVRSTRLYNGHCTGGLSDDRRPGADEIELVEFLTNRGRYPAASAKARFEERATRTEFSVELEDAPTGEYTLRVDGTNRGTLRVVSTARGTQGEVEYRSPVEPGKMLLDFDPRDAVVEIVDAGGVLFDGVLDGAAGGGGSVTPPPPGGVERGAGYYELVVEPAGNDGPELHAKLEQRSDRVEFSVELEDVPVGDYVLRSAGASRGTITVVAVDGGSEGEIEFRDPVEAGKVLLDFDPRGQVLSAERNGVVVLTGTFPLQPTGPLDDGDNGGDDNDDGSDDGSDDNGGGGSAPPAGLSSVVLSSTGVDADAHGEATYEGHANEQEFEVEVEDLPDGSYDLVVGGTLRARFTVADEEGEIKFNQPARAGRELLDFDPRGKLIEVSRNGVVYVSGTLP